MNKWQTWYKVLVGLGSVSTIYVILDVLRLDRGYVPSYRLEEAESIIIAYIIVWALFHFIAYKGIYLHYYKKQQKQNIINEITALTLLKEQGIVSQDEYSSKVDVLKNELLGL